MNFQSVGLSVPGNILLAGEYAIIEEGGLGLSLALDCRLEAQIIPANIWSLEGRYPGGGEIWREGQEPTSLGSLMLTELLNRLAKYQPNSGAIILDSSEFFDSHGRKMGFGSSAAVACALTALVMGQCGMTPTQIEQDGPLLAVQVHRKAQGGKGSGYDVMTSFTGSTVLFTGGVIPQVKRTSAPWLPALALFSGPQLVRTQGAISAWNQFKTVDPEKIQSYIQNNNRLIKALSQSQSWEQGRPLWESLRDLGITLGRDLGVSAQIDVSLVSGFPQTKDLFYKSSGAGNETGLLATDEHLPENFLPLVPASQGLVWKKEEAGK